MQRRVTDRMRLTRGDSNSPVIRLHSLLLQFLGNKCKQWAIFFNVGFFMSHTKNHFSFLLHKEEG